MGAAHGRFAAFHPDLFTHADWKLATDYFISCNTVWGELMFRLKKAAAEAKNPGPRFSADGMAYEPVL